MWCDLLIWFGEIPAGAWGAFWGLVGVIAGAVLAAALTSRRERRQRQLDFVGSQLSEFYSPLLGLRSEIAAHSALRVRLQNEANAAWQELCAGVALGPAAQQLTATRFPQFEALIQYDNDKLRETLMPAYRKMLDVFRDKLWLAEAGTRTHYPALVEFVDVWQRSLAGSLPREVLTRIGHTEATLNTFYEDLQAEHDRLRATAAQG